jgi:hypothetical protein
MNREDMTEIVIGVVMMVQDVITVEVLFLLEEAESC